MLCIISLFSSSFDGGDASFSPLLHFMLPFPSSLLSTVSPFLHHFSVLSLLSNPLSFVHPLIIIFHLVLTAVFSLIPYIGHQCSFPLISYPRLYTTSSRYHLTEPSLCSAKQIQSVLWRKSSHFCFVNQVQPAPWSYSKEFCYQINSNCSVKLIQSILFCKANATSFFFFFFGV